MAGLSAAPMCWPPRRTGVLCLWPAVGAATNSTEPPLVYARRLPGASNPAGFAWPGPLTGGHWESSPCATGVSCAVDGAPASSCADDVGCAPHALQAHYCGGTAVGCTCPLRPACLTTQLLPNGSAAPAPAPGLFLARDCNDSTVLAMAYGAAQTACLYGASCAARRRRRRRRTGCA